MNDLTLLYWKKFSKEPFEKNPDENDTYGDLLDSILEADQPDLVIDDVNQMAHIKDPENTEYRVVYLKGRGSLYGRIQRQLKVILINREQMVDYDDLLRIEGHEPTELEADEYEKLCQKLVRNTKARLVTLLAPFGEKLIRSGYMDRTYHVPSLCSVVWIREGSNCEKKQSVTLKGGSQDEH